MDQAPAQDSDLDARKAALEARRARLRDYADMVLNIIEALPAPEDLISAGRAVRVAAALDRFYVRLFSEPNLRQVASMEHAVRRVVRPEPAPALQPELTPKEVAARAEQAEATLQATRLALERKLGRYFQSLPSKRATSGSATPLSNEPLSNEPLSDETLCDETLCDETLCDETLCDETPGDETPTQHSAPPNSHMSGDATPAPNVAKTDPPRRGPSIRSLGPDWPPGSG